MNRLSHSQAVVWIMLQCYYRCFFLLRRWRRRWNFKPNWRRSLNSTSDASRSPYQSALRASELKMSKHAAILLRGGWPSMPLKFVTKSSTGVAPHSGWARLRRRNFDVHESKPLRTYVRESVSTRRRGRSSALVGRSDRRGTGRREGHLHGREAHNLSENVRASWEPQTRRGWIGCAYITGYHYSKNSRYLHNIQ